MTAKDFAASVIVGAVAGLAIFTLLLELQKPKLELEVPAAQAPSVVVIKQPPQVIVVDCARSSDPGEQREQYAEDDDFEQKPLSVIRARHP
jgi:hypothetical protein